MNLIPPDIGRIILMILWSKARQSEFRQTLQMPAPLPAIKYSLAKQTMDATGTETFTK